MCKQTQFLGSQKTINSDYSDSDCGSSFLHCTLEKTLTYVDARIPESRVRVTGRWYWASSHHKQPWTLGRVSEQLSAGIVVNRAGLITWSGERQGGACVHPGSLPGMSMGSAAGRWAARGNEQPHCTEELRPLRHRSKVQQGEGSWFASPSELLQILNKELIPLL